MCVLRRLLWKRLQNDDAVPTNRKRVSEELRYTSRGECSEGWIDLPAAPSPIVCCGLVEFQGLMVERSPGRAIKVSAPTASPDWSGTSAQCPPRRCPARPVLCRTPAIRQDGEDCWADPGRLTGPRRTLQQRITSASLRSRSSESPP
jgi:hypothetical protein